MKYRVGTRPRYINGFWDLKLKTLIKFSISFSDFAHTLYYVSISNMSCGWVDTHFYTNEKLGKARKPDKMFSGISAIFAF